MNFRPQPDNASFQAFRPKKVNVFAWPSTGVLNKILEDELSILVATYVPK